MVDLRQNPAARASLKYHDFPMRQNLKFSSTVAQLLPVYQDFLEPGDKVRISQYLKTRTQPLASAAMTKLTEHVEWFFVPIHQIYKPFTGLIYGIQDLDSSLYDALTGNVIDNKFPYLPYQEFMRAMVDGVGALLDKRTLKGEDLICESMRLLDHFGVPLEFFANPVLPDQNYFSWTPLFACAYQKIFMDHYRNGDRIANDPSCYNLDRFFNDSQIFDSLRDQGIENPIEYVIEKFYQMRYRPIERDFYTNTFPSPVFSDGSSSAQEVLAGDVLTEVNQWLTNVRSVKAINVVGGDDSAEDNKTTVSLPNPSLQTVVTHELNPANIRTLFAVEKLLELTRRAGKHYDAQTLAHFGVEVPTTIEGQSFKLGSHSQDIMIGDVVATAETPASGDYAGVPLGEIGGKGYSAGGNKPFDFQAPCHGVLMCIYSCTPVIDYFEQGMDKLNALIDKSDFFIPEYDNLGMQPLFGYQTYLKKNAFDDKPTSWNTRILNWQYRYMEKKCKPNLIKGALKYTQRHWVVGKDSGESSGTDASHFYHDPDALNSIMEYPYLKGFISDGTSTLSRVTTSAELYEQDPLIHEIFFDVVKASKMSPYGLQKL